MPNVDAFEQLEAAAQYEREGVHRGVLLLKKYAPYFEQFGNAITRSVTASLTTTVTAVKATAGNVYAVFVISPAGATQDAYVQVFNVAAASVTLGTTDANGGVIVCPAAKSATRLFVPGNDSNDLFDTAISIAATTTGRGNTALATASLPTVWVLYA